MNVVLSKAWMDEVKILFALSMCTSCITPVIEHWQNQKKIQSTEKYASVIQVSNDKHIKSLMLQKIVLFLRSKRNKKKH